MKHFIALITCLLLAGQAGSQPPVAVSVSGAEAEVNVNSTANANSGATSSSLATSIDTNNASADSTDINVYESWALSIPGSTRAPAVALECLEHTAGWSIGPLFSKSGKTQYNIECVQFSRCLAVVNAYAALGVIDNALGVLTTCLQPGEDDGRRNQQDGQTGDANPTTDNRRSETQDRSRRIAQER